MIALDRVTKVYHLHGRRTVVANNITAIFPSKTSVALIGRNGAGKSSLLRMIAGTMKPDDGAIYSDGDISWPVGFAGSFHPELTGAQNTRFLARVYGVDSDQFLDFVEDFANLGKHFYQPFRSYSAGMRSRLAFGTSMGIRFDTYLVDEVTSVGDRSFKRRSEEVFQERMKDAGAVVVGHSMGMLRRMCQAGAVLEDGILHYFDEIEDAIRYYEEEVST